MDFNVFLFSFLLEQRVRDLPCRLNILKHATASPIFSVVHKFTSLTVFLLYEEKKNVAGAGVRFKLKGNGR